MASGDGRRIADPNQPLELTYGNTARDRARGRRARRVFHSTLAAELNDRGAATVEELYLRFDCFLLPLLEPEIRQVLESARREALVAEVSDERDGYGATVEEQWTTTEKGQRLRRPRALALPDLGYLLFGESDRAAKAFDVGKTLLTMLVPLLALVGIERWEAGEVAKWAAFAGVGAVIFWMVAYGLRGELDLRAAADSWPRLEEQRPQRWKYQMSWIRTGYLAGVLAAVYAAAGLALGFGLVPLWWYGVGAAAVLAAAVYLVIVFPLYHAWHKQDPDRCREEWEKRGNEAATAIAQARGIARSADGASLAEHGRARRGP